MNPIRARLVKPVLVLLSLQALSCGLASPASAQTPGRDHERQAVTAERQALSERFAAEERECALRFLATSCGDEVRARRREALAPLRERELRLEEADRRRRADERRAAIASKQAAAASRPSAASAPPAPELRVRQAAPPATAAARGPHRRDESTARTAEAEQRVKDAQQRRQEAAAAEQRIERRQAQRQARSASSGRLPQALPVPTAASRPSR